MLEVDAYDHACTLWGAEAAVWRAAPDRVVVGRWVPLAGAFGPERLILRTKLKGLQVLGEGSDWAAAFNKAEARRKELGVK